MSLFEVKIVTRYPIHRITTYTFVSIFFNRAEWIGYGSIHLIFFIWKALCPPPGHKSD